ncbi:MAG: HlyD family efflux transporter periplasmic adaptor subunit [Planctomycetota bacterium]|nr:HlyD family efflux transporter periplasmic adaptor subunit [Planctomycetota bacterium]
MSEQNPSPSAGSPRVTATLPVRPGRSAERKRGNAIRWAVVLGVLAAVGGAAAWYVTSRPEALESLGPVVKVSRGPLLVTLSEKAEIEAADKLVISNTLRRNVVIKAVAPQGPIAKGALVVEFECKELDDALDDAEIEVLKVANLLEDAVQSRALKDKETAFAINKGDAARLDAIGEIERYKKEQITLFAEARSDIKLADQEVTLAEEKLKTKREINQQEKLKDSYSKNELENDQLKIDQLKVKADKARTTLEMLEAYDHAKKLRELHTKMEEADLDLDKARLTRKAQLAIADNTVETYQKSHARRIERRNDLLGEKKQLRYVSPRDGIVIYDTGERWRWRSDVEMRVGEPIGPLQQIITIPDLKSLQVKLTVHEAVFRHIRVGLPATIRLDSEPEKPLRGTITHVASIAVSQDSFMNRDVKVFDVTIAFDPSVDRAQIKPGSSAGVDMVLVRADNVLSAPVAAVYARQDKYYCRRLAAGGAVEAVPVTTGLMNDRRVEILSGLQEGDTVLLTAPKLTEQERREAAEKDAPAPAPAGAKGAPPSTRPALGGDTRPAPASRPAPLPETRP